MIIAEKSKKSGLFSTTQQTKLDFLSIFVYHLNMEERLRKLKDLREKGINPYPYKFEKTHNFSEIKENFEKLNQSETVVTTAGRILTIRGHGKTAFATLSDENTQLQIYLRRDRLNEKFELFKLFDLGDFIGIKGTVFKTRTGEITVLVDEFSMLSKSLRPLPEKWHGLKDIELKYRKRYLDLIANPEVREFFKKRTALVNFIRQFLNQKGFLEVETPILQPIYGGAAAQPFKTFYNALQQEMYLRIADELYLKRLIVGGYEKVYEICRDFRNEGLDRFHNPEFTMIEAYEAYTDYEGMMELVEELFQFLVDNLLASSTIKFGDNETEIKKPFKRISYIDTLNKKVGFDILNASPEQIDNLCKELKIDYKGLSPGSKIDKIFSALVQKEIIEPTFITDYPKLISPLAKEHRKDKRLVERFELVIFGLELANAFSELNNPIEQRRRFEAQLAQHEEGIREIDEDFIEALEYGMPPTGGLGIGIDRLCMVLFGQPSIRDVILFPQLRKD